MKPVTLAEAAVSGKRFVRTDIKDAAVCRVVDDKFVGEDNEGDFEMSFGIVSTVTDKIWKILEDKKVDH